MPPQAFLSFQVSVDRSDVILIFFSLYVRIFVPLAAQYCILGSNICELHYDMMWHRFVVVEVGRGPL